ncbi:hypothetical protein [Caldicellulosiruptor morganii]|uniref:Uncharacterized protein n=1 Tax=Caldicellulosiruptor morganii TaxID=1387555 RepID=A0ABY7BKD2_9FIRM|nr:hypothetical protein [Caldicellulosiruptor morganii]WAM33044.1 hypothetical protein OTK00_001505 [Caldicellulosiruptor morganii]
MFKFIQSCSEVAEEEKKLLREWFEEKGKDYILNLIDLVEAYGEFIDNFEAVIDYYIFYLEDAYKSGDFVEVIDWLYGISKSVIDRLSEKFDFNLKSELVFDLPDVFEFEKINKDSIVKTCSSNAGFYLYYKTIYGSEVNDKLGEYYFSSNSAC